MIFQYTHHALKQMQRRRISKFEVESAYRDPEITRPGNEEPRRMYLKHVAGRHIKVVAIPDDPVVIITTAVVDEEG